MQFGPVSVDQALGAVLAHSVVLAAGRLRKGMVLEPADIAALQAQGIDRVVVARLEAGDIGEDQAAALLAQALVPDAAAQGLRVTTAYTGRVNLNAVGPGVVQLDASAVLALNRVDPAITLATLAPMTRVVAGSLVGTVKIIAYGVDGGAMMRACAQAKAAIRVQPVVLRSAGLILTWVPGQNAKLAAKGRRAVDARLRALGMTMAACLTVPHNMGAIADAVAAVPGDLVLILTGSATSDLHDVAPEGLRAAGGTVLRFGMPVDPGNLLFLGRLGARAVVGLPGCARSPALNGADWVLERLACGIEVTGDDIAARGVGGLVKEIKARPQLREPR